MKDVGASEASTSHPSTYFEKAFQLPCRRPHQIFRPLSQTHLHRHLRARWRTSRGRQRVRASALRRTQASTTEMKPAIKSFRPHPRPRLFTATAITTETSQRQYGDTPPRRDFSPAKRALQHLQSYSPPPESLFPVRDSPPIRHCSRPVRHRQGISLPIQ